MTPVKPLILSDRLDTDAAPPLRDALLGARGGDLCIDASQVTRMGGLCLSVLASAALTWREAGHAFHINTPSESFLATCNTLGCDLSALSSEIAA